MTSTPAREPTGRGYDPITQQYLAGWERLANIAGALPIFGLSGANLCKGEHAVESLRKVGEL